MTAPGFPPDSTALREAVIATARALPERGLTRGTSGNVSVRTSNGLLITPSGIPYAALTVDLIVAMDLDGGYRGDTLPSSEWRMHLDIYLAKPEAGAVVHCHSPRATALSCLRRGIPAFHYMVALAGGDRIDCAAYATFGTRALSEAMLAALGARNACLLANHGQIACGASLAKALSIAEGVEELSDQYLSALSVGEPTVLDAAEMAEILRKFRSYGRQPDDLDPDAGPAFELPVRRD
ncbi:class II aldolase/adducin family protein [Polymorphum gilvum]|uniref:Class II Aldolase and Adducin N-terminal domain, putative n=1 Tax=Polymorphum gilvum (strain LMG 25793 / CGMCC 1.9160 / SL003B-26A1) TaxID=991905 RepID=F2J4D2_POLGS|nr:class II aldolase/adducin family protein [Polymorphum gilvum]ADZ71074.1 Class II Aldolase and Adducin N-terminal domain, putative [Polymorphum gilvum SL003B-26A1]